MNVADPSEDDVTVSALLSSLEFTEVIFCFGFLGWVQKCMEAAGTRGLGALDIVVLHAVNHRAKGRRLNEIAMVLNVDDTHLVGYSLKKLVAAGLVRALRAGRESRYETTEAGDEACYEYRVVREKYLIPSVRQLVGDPRQLEAVSVFLRTLTGSYDQAKRFATAFSSEMPKRPPVRTKK